MRDSGHVVVCKKKKAVQWQEETLALSGTQRHLGGPLCTNKQQKLHVLWFVQAKLPDSLLWLHIYFRDGVIGASLSINVKYSERVYISIYLSIYLRMFVCLFVRS